MRSICLLGVQVAVEGKGWMVLAKDNYYYERNCTPVLQTMVTVFLLLGESLTSVLKHHSAHKYPLVKGLLHSPRLLKKETH